MQTVSGQVERFLQDPKGDLHGLVLDGGQVVRFPVDQGHLVTLIVCVGSHVGVEGVLHAEAGTSEYWDATLITNFDSKRSVTFLAPKCQVKPGMLQNAPSSTASLVHPTTQVAEGSMKKKDRGETVPELRDQLLEEIASHPEAQPSTPPPQPASHASHPPVPGLHDASVGIGQAYDRLHRVQAILAYLHIMKRKVPGISQFLDEAKHTYEQALARFEARNYVAASEFAAASASLSRVVEIIMSRTLRSDTSLPSLVPPPPGHSSHSNEPSHVEGDLAEAESVLARIHWLLENGTLPLEDRTQVRKIASWGDALYKQARHSYRHAALPDASELAQAALAGAYSAEHVCRKWYVGQVATPSDRASETVRPH